MISDQITPFVTAINNRVTTLEDVVIKMYDEIDKNFNKKITDQKVTNEVKIDHIAQIIDHFGKGKSKYNIL